MKYRSPFPTSGHVILHHDCPDGFTGALVLEQALMHESNIPVVRSIPVQYGQPLPKSLLSSDIILLVDFSYKYEEMVNLCKQVYYVIVLDHHKTAKEELAKLKLTDIINVAIFFDMERSGARMAWDFLQCMHVTSEHKPEDVLLLETLPGQSDADTPELIRYVEDRDLWRFKLPQSREISMYLRSLPFVKNIWYSLLQPISWESNFDVYVREGEAIRRFQRQQIDASVTHAVDINFPLVPGSNDFRQVKIVNTTVNHSEVAEELYLRYDVPFTVTWFYREEDGKFVYSLRSNRGVDVSQIAKAYGGGGHPAASGFESDTMIKGI